MIRGCARGGGDDGRIGIHGGLLGWMEMEILVGRMNEQIASFLSMFWGRGKGALLV